MLKVIVRSLAALYLLGAPAAHADDPDFLNDILLDAGVFVPGPFPNDAYKQIHLQGTLAGEGHLSGVSFDMVNAAPIGIGNSSQDSSRLRAIIGQVATKGPGSVRGVHATAYGAPGSTGTVNSINAEVNCPIGNPGCRGIEIAATGPGAAHGILFGTSGQGHFDYLINTVHARVDNAFALLPTASPGGLLTWSGGGGIYSPSPGVIRIDGTLQSATIAALEARIKALESALAIAAPSPPPTPPPPTPAPPPKPPLIMPVECHSGWLICSLLNAGIAP